ncbi:MAG: hypothetical protein ACWA5U_05065 [bacterium]
MKTALTHTFIFSSLFCLNSLAIAVETSHDTHDHANETAEEHAKHTKQQNDSHADETAEEHAKHAGKTDTTPTEHEHGKPHHGGIVSELDHIHHELVQHKQQIHLYAEGLPNDDTPVSARLTILRGKDKQTFQLTASESDKHRFETEGTLQVGDKVVALIKIDGEKPRLVKFEVESL